MAAPDTVLETPDAIGRVAGESSAALAAAGTMAPTWTKHRNYVLFILFVCYFLNSIDRNIFSILQQSIKEEFGLRDWQLGLMTGSALAFFYTAVGLPAAHLVDRGVKRTSLIAVALAFWSLMTGLCGLAQGFWQLLLGRAGVGVGEGSFGPPGFTLISDYFRPNERARAMSVFLLGLPAASIVGLATGGYIANHYGWRAALMVVGLPGIVVALIFKLSVREPPRGLSDGKAEAPSKAPMSSVLRTATRKKTFVHLIIAASLASFSTVGGMTWFPTFLQRSFSLNPEQIGISWGVTVGLTGMAGALLGGWLSDTMGARNPKYVMIIPGVAMLVCLPFYLLATATSHYGLAFAFLVVPATLNNSWLPSAMSLTQGLAPIAMRALIGMFVTMAAHLVGHGLAPLFIGAASDLFTARLGPTDGLRWALVSVSIFYPWAALHFWLASRTVAQDLER